MRARPPERAGWPFGLALAACLAACSSPPPPSAASAAVTVLAIGDSITHGEMSGAVAAGDRPYLRVADDLLADGATWTIVGRSDASRAYPSREAFMSLVIRPFNARMSQGLRPAIRQLTTDGDKLIIFFDAAGVAKDGVPYANTYAWFWEMRDGRVVRAHAFYDSLAFNDLWRRVAP